MLGTEFQDMLRCIRCAACMNHCPVYHAIGGHAYGYIYPGPMGAVLTPSLIGVDKGGHLPNASTFCGRCESVCPVRIPLPKMMRHWREREFERHLAPQTVRFGLGFWAFFARRPALYRLATRAAMGALALLLGLLTVAGVVQLWQVYALALLQGCAAAFDAPVRQTFVAELVGDEDLSNAVALNSTSFNAGRMVGPAVAGLTIASIGTGWAFLINGASFVAVLVSLAALRASELRPNARTISLGTGDLYIKSNYQDFQRFADVDVAIAGDGEATMPMLIEAVKRLVDGGKKSAFEVRGKKFAADHMADLQKARGDVLAYARLAGEQHPFLQQHRPSVALVIELGPRRYPARQGLPGVVGRLRTPGNQRLRARPSARTQSISHMRLAAVTAVIPVGSKQGATSQMSPPTRPKSRSRSAGDKVIRVFSTSSPLSNIQRRCRAASRAAASNAASV